MAFSAHIYARKPFVMINGKSLHLLELEDDEHV